MRSWKTTLLGVGTILTAAGDLITTLVMGDTSHITIDSAMLFAGLQGIFSKDFNVSGK